MNTEISVSGRTELRNIISDRIEHHVMVEGLILQGSLMCMFLTTAEECLWQKLIEPEGELGAIPVIAGGVSTLLQKWIDPIGRKSVRTVESTIRSVK